MSGRWVRAASRLLLDREGPLTRDLRLAPGGGGLGLLPARLAPDATARLVCGFCSTGCGLDVHLRGGRAVNLSPAAGYPVNDGHACPKGWEALAPLAAPDRAIVPLLRRARGRREAVTWPTALAVMTERLKGIQERHGPEAVAFLGTGQIVTEELAFLGALAKLGMGMRHGDGNTRQCMASAVVAYKQSFGFDAPPYTYADLEESDVVVLVGSNMCIAHPILWQRLRRNRRSPTVIAVDPRKTETAMAATRHLALRPKSDLVLFYGLAHLLIQRGWIDRPFIDAHTTDFEAFAAFCAAYTPERVAEATGIGPAELEAFAAAVHGSRRVSFWWTMGVNQGHEAVRVAQAIINIALITGNIGRPGTGPNSITGQCNAMGSRLFSNTTNLLGGHDFADPAHRRKVSAILGIDEGRIPADAGWSYDRILEGILAGKIRGLWIVATNPAHSWINQSDLRDVLGRLEFLVVQDMYTSSETAEMADLMLPAAGWGEKEGTFINSERRVGAVRKVARAPGQALADFQIFRLVAQAWGCGDMFARWTSPESVFQILKELSRGQPCDISGIADYRALEQAGGIQWPFPVEANIPSGGEGGGAERRLFEDGRFFHADGRARLLYEPERPLPEPPSADYPLLLVTGRGSSTQWHTETRTRRSGVLRRLAPQQVHVHMNPVDARLRGLVTDQEVVVASRRGEIAARAFITNSVPPGQVFMAMHDASVNRLTFPAFDPYSRQPAYKAAAVEVRTGQP